MRAAVGDQITKGDDGMYLIDNAVRTRIRSSAEPVLRQSAGKWELLVPVSEAAGAAEVIQEIVW